MLSILFLFFFAGAEAQLDKDVWLVNGWRHLGEGFKEYRVDFVLDGRNSFDEGTPVSVGGIRIGIEHHRVNRIGIGFYGLNQPVQKPAYTSADTSASPVRFSLNYRTLYYERVLYFNPKWEWSGTLHLGAGEVEVVGREPDTGDWSGVEVVNVNPVELSSSGFYHLSWWLSVGFGAGYRWMLNTPEQIRPSYASTVYLAKVKLRIGKLVRRIGNKDVRNEY